MTNRVLAMLSCVLGPMAWTTPVAAQIPTPASVLGFSVGADFRLASYDVLHTLGVEAVP